MPKAEAASHDDDEHRSSERDEGYHSSFHALSFQKNSAAHPHCQQVVSPCGRYGLKPIQTWRLGPGALNL